MEYFAFLDVVEEGTQFCFFCISNQKFAYAGTNLNGSIELYGIFFLWEANKEVSVSKSTACFWSGEVGPIRVYIEDHVGCNILNCGVFVDVEVVQ